MIHAKAFTETVYEEIKDENDALISRSYNSDSKQSTQPGALTEEGVDSDGNVEDVKEVEQSVIAKPPVQEGHSLLSA